MKIFSIITLVLTTLALRAEPFAVMVAGYHNEKIPQYFLVQKKVLKENFSIDSKIIGLPSENSLERNALILAAQLKKVARPHRELIILAHSKGGIETLLAYLYEDEAFLLKKTEKIVLIQSPLKGSPYADFYWKKSDQQNALLWGYYVYSRTHYRGFLSMRSKQVRSSLKKAALGVPKDILKNLSTKVFYWRSSIENAPVAYDQYLSAIEDFGDSDGLVPSSHMLLEKLGGLSPFGTDLGVFTGFHHLKLVAPKMPFKIEDLENTRVFLESIISLN